MFCGNGVIRCTDVPFLQMNVQNHGQLKNDKLFQNRSGHGIIGDYQMALFLQCLMPDRDSGRYVLCHGAVLHAGQYVGFQKAAASPFILASRQGIWVFRSMINL